MVAIFYRLIKNSLRWCLKGFSTTKNSSQKNQEHFYQNVNQEISIKTNQTCFYFTISSGIKKTGNPEITLQKTSSLRNKMKLWFHKLVQCKLHRSILIAGKGHECFISKTCEIEVTKIRQLSNIIWTRCLFMCICLHICHNYMHAVSWR